MNSLPIIKTILSDSDLDGIVSAAMLRVVFPDAQVVLSEPAAMQLGDFSVPSIKQTVIADLAYVEGVGLYFDHHESNRPDHDEFNGAWEPKDSAAHVVYDHFKDEYDLGSFSELIPEVDKLDMAKFSLEEYLNPGAVLELGLAIDRGDKAFNHLLVELLAAKGWDFVYAHEAIKQKLAETKASKQTVTDYIKTNLEVKNGVGFISMDDLAVEVRISSFDFTSLMPELDGLAVFKPHDKYGFKVTFYGNSFKTDAFDYDFLQVARQLNPDTAGGHKKACGFIPSEDQTRESVTQRIQELLQEQRGE